MKTRNASWLAGALFLILSGSALAHQSAHHQSYPPDWNGSVMVYGGAHGPAGWSGSLSYGSPYFYAPGYIPWTAIPAGHRHNARCNHGPRHDYNGPRHDYNGPRQGYYEAYQRGYDHGRDDDHRHRGKHGKRGHGRDYDD